MPILSSFSFAQWCLRAEVNDWNPTGFPVLVGVKSSPQDPACWPPAARPSRALSHADNNPSLHFSISQWLCEIGPFLFLVALADDETKYTDVKRSVLASARA